MHASGYCMFCERRLPIRALRSINPSTGRHDYGPIEHKLPDIHVGCSGEIDYVEDADRSTTHPQCRKCVRIVTDDEVTPSIEGGRCPGSGRAIR
jgi:hypothetical protein